MEKTKEKIAVSVEDARRITTSVIKGTRCLVEISESLLKNEKIKTILEPLLLDENYGIRTYQKRLEKNIFRIGILSNQSCGKSFLYNTLLGIPLLPVANLRTSSAKLQIIYGKHCSIEIRQIGAERIVCNINCDTLEVETLKTDTLEAEPLKAETLKALKEFVCHCYKVIDLQNIWYFLPAEMNPEEVKPENAEKLEINPDEPWHMAFLWMTLLTAYINQNENRENLKDEWSRALSARKKLYENLKLDSGTDYDITLYLDNSFLASGISLVDLPGVGAAVKSTGKAKSHDQIAIEAVRDTDAIIVATDKTITGGAVNKALDPLLKCAQFKYEGSRENRIIPLLTKVDTITGRGIRQQVENIKDAFITEILAPNNIMLTRDDIHCVSALNAEYIFCENAGIPYERCALVVDLKCNTLEDMKKKYEESSYIPEFSAFLQDYAVRGQIMTSSELFAQCIVYAQKCVEILEGQLEDSLISLEFFENISEEILECLTDIMQESFAEIIDRITEEKSGIIDRYMKDLEGIREDLKNEVNTKVHAKLVKEIQEAKDDLMKEARSLQHNGFGDVVLFRKDKKGNITYEPAYYKCVSMLDEFSKTNYGNTQAAILQSMSNAIGEIGKVLTKMDAEVVDAYAELNEKFNNLTKQVEARFSDNNLNANSLFVKTLIDRCKQIVKANADIENDLAFANSTQDLEQNIRTSSLGIISSFIADMSARAANIKEQCTHTGFFRTKTTVIYYNIFLNQLSDNIMAATSADNECANIVGEMDRLFNYFFQEVKTSKSAPATGPCINMQKMAAKMRDNLLINKGSDETVIRGKLYQIWREYCNFVDKMNTSYTDMYSSFDSIRKDSNSFSVLVSGYTEKNLKIKAELPKRVEKALENN